jgi:hypothetical protein
MSHSATCLLLPLMAKVSAVMPRTALSRILAPCEIRYFTPLTEHCTRQRTIMVEKLILVLKNITNNIYENIINVQTKL